VMAIEPAVVGVAASIGCVKNHGKAELSVNISQQL
jgi:hypothetical protein